MKNVELSKKDLCRELFEGVLFFMIAEGGAMGEMGAVNFIRDNGVLYHTNYVFGDVTMEDIVAAFPQFKNFKFTRNGKDKCEWHYVNLGMGNHLMVADSVYSRFSELISCYNSRGEIYKNWPRHAIEALSQIKGMTELKKTAENGIIKS